MKKFFKSTMLLTMLLITTSCGGVISSKDEVRNNEEMKNEQTNSVEKEESTYDKIYSMLMNLEDYEAIAEVTYISNKNQNTYLTRQKARKNGQYKIEVIGPEDVAGTITIFDGEVIYQHNPKNSGEVYMATEDAQERSELFLTTFIENYSKSLNSAVAVGNFENGKETTFETNIPGGNPYISKEVLFVDNETLTPKKLVIYDEKGAERIIITYKEFIYNPKILDNEFKIVK